MPRRRDCAGRRVVTHSGATTVTFRIGLLYSSGVGCSFGDIRQRGMDVKKDVVVGWHYQARLKNERRKTLAVVTLYTHCGHISSRLSALLLCAARPCQQHAFWKDMLVTLTTHCGHHYPPPAYTQLPARRHLYGCHGTFPGSGLTRGVAALCAYHLLNLNLDIRHVRLPKQQY